MNETNDGSDIVEYGPVTVNMVARLGETRPWVLLIGVLGFIGAGLMVVFSGFMLLAGAFAPTDELGGAATAGLALVYLLMAAVYVFISLYLVRYAAAIKALVTTRQTLHMEKALEHQRSFWRIAGIITLLYIALAFIGMFFMVLVGIMAAAT